MTNLVIGMGQIGSVVTQVLVDRDNKVLTLDLKTESVRGDIDVLHICFGYSDKFVKAVKRYQKKYQPSLIIIYSTVPIGTTKQIEHAVHSPIEGRHPRLYKSLQVADRFIGYKNRKDAKLAQKIWNKNECHLIPNSDWTEFLKLASTSKFGINLVWADYMAEVCKDIGMDYDLVKVWDRSYNRLYKDLRYSGFRKFIIDPPEGTIGGHCVVPNAFLLDEQYPHDMLKQIKEMK